MKRKILRVGGSSYAISLPMDFIELNNMHTGEELDVEHHGATVTIRCENPKSATKAIDISEFTIKSHEEKIMDKIIGALFKQGLDSFSLKCTDKQKADIIREILRKGKLSMYEQPQDADISTVLVRSSITHFDENALGNMCHVIIKRVYNNFEDFLAALRTLKGDAFRKAMESLSDRDKIIGEDADICRRIINKNVIDYRSTTMYNFIDKLEKIGDAMRDLALFAKENPAVVKRYHGLLEKMHEFFCMLYHASRGFSIKKINSFYERCFEFEDEVERCDDKNIYHCMKTVLTITKSAYSNMMIMNL